MTELTRACTDCGTDISERHGLAKRCRACARASQLEISKAKARTMYDKACERCGEAFRTRVKHGRFCGTRCAGLATHPGNVERTCNVCDTVFAVSRQYDRDTCSRPCTEFAQRYPGRKKPTLCGRCQKPITRLTLRAVYCSYLCAAVAGQARREGRAVVVPRQFCLACGGPIAGRTARALFCSRACQASKGHERRAAKIAGARIERVYPIDIYERDGWICHLCLTPIDPYRTDQYDPERVSIDHIIPVAAPGFPGHIWENLAAAHLRCNIVKGSKATGRDWKLHKELKSLREGATTWQPKRQAPTQPPLFDAYSTTGLTARGQRSSSPAPLEPLPDVRLLSESTSMAAN